MTKYRRICDGFVMDMKTGVIEEESNIQYVPYANPIISADPVTLSSAFFAAGGSAASFTALGGFAGFTAIAGVLSNLAASLLIGALTGSSGVGGTGQARDEGVKTRVSPDTANRLPVIYGEQRMKGTVVMSELDTSKDKWAIIIGVAEGESDGVNKISAGDKVLTFDGDVETGLRDVTNAVDPLGEEDDSYNEGRMKMRFYSQGGRCTEMEEFNEGNNAWVNDGLKSDRRLPLSYLYIELEYNQENGITSLGNINFEVRGKRVRTINSDGTLSINRSYSTNPAECLVDYLTDKVSGGRWEDYRLDLQSFLELKDFCNEQADYVDTNGTTRKATRYTCNGVINTNRNIDENIQELLICCQSVLSYGLGQFKVIINDAKDATHSFTDDNIVGTVRVNDAGFDVINNEVIMHFTSKKNKWQDDQVDAVSTQSVRNNNEPELSTEIGLSFINNSIEAQRLAHIDLNQWRQNLVIKFDTFISGLEVEAGDVIEFTHETVGSDMKLYRVLQVEETSSGPGSPLGLSISALEYDETVYTINAPHEADNAKNTNLPDPTIGITLSNVQSSDTSTRDASTGLSNISSRITWDCSVPSYVLEYEIEYKLTTDTDYLFSFSTTEAVTLSNLDANSEYDIRIRAFIDSGRKSDYVVSTFTAGGSPVLISPTALNISEENVVITEATGAQVRVTATWSKPNVTFPVRYVLEYKLSSASIYTDSVSVDETVVHILPFETGVYDFRVKAIDVNEISSGYTTVTDKSIVGLTDIPADVTNFSIAATSTQALLSWTLAPDVDVRTGGHVEIRYHSSTTSSANWAGAQSLISNVPGSATSVSVPLLKGTYLVKFIDSGNRESLNASIVTNSFVSSNFAFVTSLIEDPTYLGAKNNCTVVDGTLSLDSGENSMVYHFNNLVDLGTIRSIKVDPDLEVDVQAIGNQVCNVSSMCSELNFCGVQEAAAVQLEMSTTDDDTTGTPTWSPWKSLIPGEYTARGFRFRLGVLVFDTNTAAKVQKLRVEFDAENITQRGSVTTTTVDTTVTFPTAFYSGTAGTTKPNIGTQIIGGSAGDEVVIVSISNTGFVLGTYNNGTRVSRTVNWQAVGE